MIRPLFLACVGLSLAAQDVHAFTLANGLRVVLVEDHRRPLVRATLRTEWGAGEEPAGQEGLGAFLGGLLDGAAGRESGESGLGLGFESTPLGFAWNLSCRSQDQTTAFEALALRLLRPGLEGPRIEAARLRAWRELDAREPAESQRRRFLDHMAGLPSATEGSLSRFGLEDLRAFLRRTVRPERAVLGLCGDLNPTQARVLLHLHLGTWGPAAEPADVRPQAAPDRFEHRADGPPAAWIGAPLPAASPRERAVRELLARLLEREEPGPLRRDPAGAPYMLTEVRPARSEALPAALAEAQAGWETLGARLGPAALESVRGAWMREWDLAALHPDTRLERALAPVTGTPTETEIRAVGLEDLRALLRKATAPAARRLLIQGVPAETLAAWRREAPAFAAWR